VTLHCHKTLRSDYPPIQRYIPDWSRSWFKISWVF